MVAGRNPATISSNIVDDVYSSKISSIFFTCSNEVDMALDLLWDSHWSGLRLWGYPL
jgi:hypothetical protein